MKIIDIWEGWKNHLLPSDLMKEQIRLVSDERLAICRECPFHSSRHNTFRRDEHCTDCGCPLVTKTKCLSCSCPQEKWLAKITPEQEQTIYDNEKSI